MILAHGDTPFHDDPNVWGALATMGGLTGLLSFGWYAVARRFRRK